jgi:DNA helicase HerA-like ATPase
MVAADTKETIMIHRSPKTRKPPMMIAENNTIYLGKGTTQQSMLLKYANRHGLIAGATGTGKTVSLQDLAEGFSASGVPVFIADIKGDLSGLAAAGQPKEAFTKRASEIGFSLEYQQFPVIFWDLFGKSGHPIRTTISEMGPLILSRLLGLNDTQEGLINIAFAVADAEGLLLLDLDDLRAMLTHLSDNAADYSTTYGNIATATVGAVQRALLTLENQGGKHMFGEPALNITDLMKIAPNGYGAVNILAADQLMQSPKLYATFMLFLLSELFEDLPEVGDVDKPKLVFFFDEAHLLFDEAPKVLVEKIEQLVKLIRSKGVGVYFITQNPQDIPESVLAQLSNRIQHALRAYTPAEKKAVRIAAESFRENPAFKTEDAITELGIGEALVSTLDSKGIPTMVERTLMRPPLSFVGKIADDARAQAISQSPLAGVYDELVNRESAYELLTQRIEQPEKRVAASSAGNGGNIWGTVAKSVAVSAGGVVARQVINTAIRSATTSTTASGKKRGRPADSMAVAIGKSVARNAGGTIGRQIVRGLLNTMLK